MISLSKLQQGALWVGREPITGSHIRLLARPGTGKTQTLTKYALDVNQYLQREPYQGIALLSYTNVASNEVSERINSEGLLSGLDVSPNFIGTFDSFINKNIFLPYGHRFMNCESRPKLVGEPYSSWTIGVGPSKKDVRCHSMYFDCFTIDINGEPRRVKQVKYINGQSRTLPKDFKMIRGMKEYTFRKGYATQADANFIAFKILSENDDIRLKIINSYPVLIIDEAQDLTEVQHAIIDLLTSGTDKVDTCILVGDPAQAIYEWNTARPDLLLNKSSFSKKELSNTYRCSGNICKLLSGLTPEYKALVVAGKNSRYQDNITVSESDLSVDDIRATYSEFLKVIKDKKPHNDVKLKVCLLSRSKDLTGKIQSIVSNSDLENFAERFNFEIDSTLYFIEVVNLLKEGKYFKAGLIFIKFWRFALSIHDDDSAKKSIGDQILGVLSEDEDEFRIAMQNLMINLAVDCKKVQKVSDVALLALDHSSLNEVEVIQKVLKDCARYVARNGGDTEITSFYLAKLSNPHTEIVDGVEIDVNIGTVHSVKGETYDGVLYFSKDKASHSQRIKHESAGSWDKILDHETSSCEEKRVVYVALSRAAQCLWICAEEKTANFFLEKIKNFA